MTTIDAGEGYWVNTAQAVDLGTQIGQGYFLGGAALLAGWNMVATADDVSPANFNRSLSGATTGCPGNLTTLWAWDNITSLWYFYAPSLDCAGTLTSYIQSKGYEDFRALTVGKGRGLWANVPNAIAGGTSSYTYANGTGTATYVADSANAAAYSNIPTIVNFTLSPNDAIPPGATVSFVRGVYNRYFNAPSNFVAGLCSDSTLVNCEDITRTLSFSTTRFNGRSPTLGYVMAFAFTEINPPPPPVSTWDYSLYADYVYPIKQFISTATAAALTVTATSSTTIKQGSSSTLPATQSGNGKAAPPTPR